MALAYYENIVSLHFMWKNEYSLFQNIVMIAILIPICTHKSKDKDFILYFTGYKVQTYIR
jgi:hypothetical protein